MKIKKFKPESGFKPKRMLIYGLVFAVIGTILLWQVRAAPGACSTTGVVGTTTHNNLSVPEAAQYRIWVRMQVPDATTPNTNGINLELDANQCAKVTTTNTAAVNQWQWINSSASDPSTPLLTSQLTAGNHTARIIGLKSGVKVDKVLLLKSDNTCIPSNDFVSGSPGDNCTTPVPTLTFSANPTSVASGGTSTLTWTSTNATGCTAGGDWSGDKAATGSEATAALTANKSYTLVCAGAGGSSPTVTAAVTVISAPTVPTLTFSANPTSVASGGTSTLTWTSTNATGCTAGGDWSGDKAATGSEATAALTANKSYTLVCAGAGGSSPTVTAAVTVAGGNDRTPPTILMAIIGQNIAPGQDEITIRNQRSIRWRPTASDASGIKTLALFVNNRSVSLNDGIVRVGVDRNGRTPNGTYVLKAVATDNANNVKTAILTVKLRHPDIDRDGAIDSGDLNLIYARNSWKTSNPVTDLTADGVVNREDVTLLLNRWNSTVDITSE